MKPKKLPMRMCLGCGEMKYKSELVRVVRTADGKAELDMGGKMNGRGAYICRSTVCLERAQKSHRFEKAFGIAIPNDVFEKLKGEFLK